MFHRLNTIVQRGPVSTTAIQCLERVSVKRNIWNIAPLENEKKPTALLITMNSNPVNVLNPKFFTDLNETLDQIEKEYSPHVPLLLSSTANNKTFSAGLDLQYVQSIWNDAKELSRFVEIINHGFVRLYNVTNPTIAVCNGHNIAGGTILLFTCDFRVMPLNNKIITCLREVQLGLNLPSCLAEIIRQQLQPGHLLYDVALTGRSFTPQELKDRNLLTDYVDYVEGSTQEEVHKKLVEKALEIATRCNYEVSGKAFTILKRNYKRPLTLDMENDRKFVDLMMDPVIQQKIQQILQSTKK